MFVFINLLKMIQMKNYKIIKVEQFTSKFNKADFYDETTKAFPWRKKFETQNLKITLLEIDENSKLIDTKIYVNAGNTNPGLLVFFSDFLKNPDLLIGRTIRCDIRPTSLNSSAYTFTPTAAIFINDEPETVKVIKGKFQVKIKLGSRHEKTQTLSITNHNKTISNFNVSFEKGDVITFLTKDLDLISCVCNRISGDSFYVNPKLMSQMPTKYLVTEFGLQNALIIDCIAAYKGTKVYVEDMKKTKKEFYPTI